MANDKQGIIPMLVGGLGNQMFEVSAGYSISKTQECPHYIPFYTNTNNPHDKNGLLYTETIFKYFGTLLPFAYDTIEMQGYCKLNKYIDHPSFSLYTPYKPWNPLDIKPGTKLTSYYQYYPAMKPFEYELRYLFLRGLQPISKDIESLLNNWDTIAFLHIRRGDYLQHSDTFFILSLEYYSNAVNSLMKENPLVEKIYVVSDDIDWVKKQDLFKHPIFVIANIQNELSTMAFMSLCKGGAICANSSFSWWGAFLGAYSERNPVIVPKRWIKNNSSDPIDLFPSEWIQLE